MEKSLNDLLDEHFQAKTKLNFLQERRDLVEKEMKQFDRKIAIIEAEIEDISSQIQTLQ